MLASSYKLLGFPCGFKRAHILVDMFKKIPVRVSFIGGPFCSPPVSKTKIKILSRDDSICAIFKPYSKVFLLMVPGLNSNKQSY